MNHFQSTFRSKHRIRTIGLPIVFAFVLFLAVSDAPAQDTEYGASSAHSQHTKPPGFSQPKRIGQYIVKQLLLGEPEKGRDYAREALERNQQDEEMYFALALVAGAQSQLDLAEQRMNRAIELGLPPGRFVAGPEQLIRPLKETATYQRIVRKIQQSTRLVHGPMVGGVLDTTVRIWVRTPDSGDVQAFVAAATAAVEGTTDGQDADREHNKWLSSERTKTVADQDFSTALLVKGLKPGTRYDYRVKVDGKWCSENVEQYFVTLPQHGEPAAFRFAFGGGAGYTPPLESMWDTIGSFQPRFLLLLGDNIYSDDPQSPGLQRYTYYRRQSRPEWRKLVARTPVMTIWDDHDFSNNDSWGGPLVDRPAWKRRVWEVFQQNWANPGYGGGADQPGCWYDFHVGDVHFVMLDCRYYRTSPRLPESERSMLGPVQKKWLKQVVSSSNATFKVLVSSVPWDYRTKGDSRDTWNGYRHERDELFSFLRDERIEGVVLISADRHRSDAWLIDQAAGKPDGLYDLYEFNSSRLTNRHVHGERQQAIFSYNDKQSFGLVTVDTTAADPTISYQVINIDGEQVERLTVKRSQLGW